MNYGAEVVSQVIDELGITIVSESSNGWGMACCPLHDEDRPSFTVQLNEGGWRCYAGCGSSGDLADLVAQVRDEDPAVVRRRLIRAIPSSDEAVLKLLEEPGEAAEVPKRAFPEYTHGVAPKYMLNRGFTLETLRAWDVGWLEADKAVALPMRWRGEDVGVILRRLYDQPKYQNLGFKKTEVIFGLDMVPDQAEEVCVFEGPLNAMWTWQCGYPSVATLSASVSEIQADILRRRFTGVVMGYDPDKAGRRGTDAALKLLHKLRVRVMRFPDGKDAQDLSSEILHQVVQTAQESWYNP